MFAGPTAASAKPEEAICLARMERRTKLMTEQNQRVKPPEQSLYVYEIAHNQEIFYLAILYIIGMVEDWLTTIIDTD